ncbi:MAG: methyltransferase domain-containing protein [Eggerthellaceae bacterium]|nr:methyltransferase domain-containing protein [Eggerthellaceae bacterium]
MSDIQKANIEEILKDIPGAASEGAWDWGNPFPLAMSDCETILVLACGAGRDAFVAGKLAGPTCRVIGVEFNADLVKKANEIKEELGANNVEFKQGCWMTLDDLGIKSDSVDLVIANGAVSRVPSVQTQLNTIYRVLKFGGEFYMSDIFVDRRTPAEKKTDEMKELGLAGALYIEDYRRACSLAGWPTIRCICTAIYKKPQPAEVADWTYFVRTMRAYKIPGILEDLCEQYGQYATYQGGIEGAPDYYDLDDHHRFVKGEPLSVCGNSCAMVENTRVGKYFKIDGDQSVHGGPYPGCGNIPYSAEEVWE